MTLSSSVFPSAKAAVNSGISRFRPYASTRNACKVCAPLGASIAYRGIEGCIPLIHGSQGCSTYIRRYSISHFREPIDIASSNFTESSAIFGGKDNLVSAIANVTRQYHPTSIGVMSTCLSETIGEDVRMYMKNIEAERNASETAERPELFYASTASYRGTHIDGFHEAILAAVSKLAVKSSVSSPLRLNLVSGFLSTEDLREFHDILSSFNIEYTLIPDYSESLDSGSWEEYQKLPSGGTKLDDIRKMGDAAATLYLGRSADESHCAGSWLERTYQVPLAKMDFPIGITQSDAFFREIEKAAGIKTPSRWLKIRARCIDAYIDGHKYCSGKKAVVYGDEDFTVGLVSFLDEIGVVPVLAATGSKSSRFTSRIKDALVNCRTEPVIMDEADFATMLETAQDMRPDFIIGNSKGYYLARSLGIPLVRCGFPIHDRMGGQRILHVGYRGALALFDSICNVLMQDKQLAAASGWTYI